jgi:hypothetical protein
MFGRSVSASSATESVDWVIRYGVESSPEFVERIPLFHSGPIRGSKLIVTRQGQDSRTAKSVLIGHESVRGLLVSVPESGIYQVELYSANGTFQGYIVPDGSALPLVWVGPGDTFYANVRIEGKSRELTSAQQNGILIGGSAAIVLVIFGALAVWRKTIRAFYAFRWRKTLAASGVDLYT